MSRIGKNPIKVPAGVDVKINGTEVTVKGPKGELKNTFRPEFLNRIDDTIVFTRLSEEDIKEIAKRLLKALEKRMSDIEITMTFDDSVIDFVSKAGYDKIYGARPLKRAIQTNIEDVLSEKILDKSIEKGNSYVCSMENNELKLRIVE